MVRFSRKIALHIQPQGFLRQKGVKERVTDEKNEDRRGLGGWSVASRLLYLLGLVGDRQRLTLNHAF